MVFLKFFLYLRNEGGYKEAAMNALTWVMPLRLRELLVS